MPLTEIIAANKTDKNNNDIFPDESDTLSFSNKYILYNPMAESITSGGITGAIYLIRISVFANAKRINKIENDSNIAFSIFKDGLSRFIRKKAKKGKMKRNGESLPSKYLGLLSSP
jgi:hypothetical protein